MKYLLIIAIVLFGCDDTDSNKSVCPSGDYEHTKLFCTDTLVQEGIEVPLSEEGNLFSCDEHTGEITVRVPFLIWRKPCNSK